MLFNLRFLCNGNSVEGIGHFFRCFHIAKLCKKKYPEIKIVFQGDFLKHIQKLILDSDFYIKKKNIFETKYYKENERLIVDTYLLDQRKIDLLSKNYSSYFIDDFNKHNFSSAKGIINFTINATNINYSNSNTFCGIEYFPYKFEFKKIRTKNLKREQYTSNTNQHILLFLSGTLVNDQMINKLFIDIDRFFKKCRFSILGSNINYKSNNENTFKNINYTDKIEHLYQKCNLIISGGGLVKYEAAYCAIPNLTLSITHDQKMETKYFQKKYLTFSIGTLFNYNSSTVKKKLTQYFKNEMNQNQFYNSSQRLFNNKSIYNLIKEIAS